MTHDPLCPQKLDGFRERCTCRIIARVRADALAEAREAVRAADLCGQNNCAADALAAIDGILKGEQA